MATIERLKPGQTVWTVISRRAGNTTLRRKVVYGIRIQEIDLEGRRVFATLSGTSAQWWPESRIKNWKVNMPEVKNSSLL